MEKNKALEEIQEYYKFFNDGQARAFLMGQMCSVLKDELEEVFYEFLNSDKMLGIFKKEEIKDLAIYVIRHM